MTKEETPLDEWDHDDRAEGLTCTVCGLPIGSCVCEDTESSKR